MEMVRFSLELTLHRETTLAGSLGDLSGDGILDVAVVHPGIGTGGHEVGVSAGKGDGRFQYPRQSHTGEEPFSVALGDFNMDGALDMAVVNALGNSVSILITTR
jgi:hypothetical protein